MGKRIPDSISFNLPNGEEISIETGQLATQADGSVVVRHGNTMVFCSVVSKKEMREGVNFFPLSVDYQEKFAAVGRIPGNFFKREARLNDYEILTCRLVDRVLRPLFSKAYQYDTQVIINLLSGDKETMPDVLAALAASAALTLSDIPFHGPISEVRVARVEGEYIVNPKRSELALSDFEIIVGATIDNVMMVEGEAKECSEADLIEAIRVGHEAIKVQCQAQLDFAAQFGKAKREDAVSSMDEALYEEVKTLTSEGCYTVAKGFLDKSTRKAEFKKVKEALKEALTESRGEEYVAENKDMISDCFNKVKKAVIRKMVLTDKVRLDGRKTDEVRPIWVEVDYLPSTHGSAVFNRGETQALATLTLGSKLDRQLMDTALNPDYSDFILHYNFPAYSVGETKPMRGPGRREVGHANLAARSLKQVLPPENPYTLRIVSDILESNGSSSMATVCAGALALMDAGIQITSPVSGIAMGLVKEGDDYAVLTDILGDEDALGDMDFKVTGTEKGICGLQMDIKIAGLPYDVLEKALEQAKEGRLHILNVMKEGLEAPRPELKPHAPRMTKINVNKSFIGAIIGPGGKIIQEMQKETGTVINIEEVNEVGVVTISGVDATGVEAALAKIKEITHVPQLDDIYEDSKVVSIHDYGCFVEFGPNRSGLVHISELSWQRIDSIEGVIKVGDTMTVKLIGIDNRTGKFKLSRKALTERPANMPPQPPRSRDNDRGRDSRGRDNRGRDNRGRDNRGRDDRRR